MVAPTVRLYLDDAHSLHATAGVLWHHPGPAPPPDLTPGTPVQLRVNPARR